MDLGLQGKVVLVSAASKGLGRAVATQYAHEGAAVMIASRSASELEKTAKEIAAASGAQVDYVVCDVTKAEDIENMIAKTVERFGRLDVLVTNAGGPPGGQFDDFADSVWEQAFQLNLLSVVRVIRAALPQLRQNKGRIVNITSTATKQPVEGLVLSNTIRAGVQGLAKTLSVELAPDHILINNVAPGIISTDRIAYLDGLNAEKTGRTVDNVREAKQGNIPLGRYGEPEEFARYVTFLGSFANTYVTGQTMLVDGGMVRAL